MDKFGVPKKINRHVLKALYHFNDSGLENPELSGICELVEYSMRNNVPIANLRGVVRQSLHNMAELGVIGTNGLHFFVQDTAVSFQRPDLGIFKSNIRRNQRSKINPNSRKRAASKDSLSGNEIEKTRKRIRGRKSFNRKGKDVDLPKAKEVTRMNWNGISSSVEEDDSRAENMGLETFVEPENGVHLGTEDQFIFQPIEFNEDLHQVQDLAIYDVIERSEERFNFDVHHEPPKEMPTVVTRNEEVKTSDDQHVEVENNSQEEKDNKEKIFPQKLDADP